MENKSGLSPRIIRVICIFILLFMITDYTQASDNERNQKTISGIVDDIDWVKSIITVRFSDPFSGDTDEINIIVPSEARITNGAQTEFFSDIDQFDSVTITYYDDGLSGLKVKMIKDLNEGNRGS